MMCLFCRLGCRQLWSRRRPLLLLCGLSCCFSFTDAGWALAIWYCWWIKVIQYGVRPKKKTLCFYGLKVVVKIYAPLILCWFTLHVRSASSSTVVAVARCGMHVVAWEDRDPSVASNSGISAAMLCTEAAATCTSWMHIDHKWSFFLTVFTKLTDHVSNNVNKKLEMVSSFVATSTS